MAKKAKKTTKKQGAKSKKSSTKKAPKKAKSKLSAKKIPKSATKKSSKKAKPAAKKSPVVKTTAAKPVTPSAVFVGMPVPEFALPATSGLEVKSESLHGKNVVIYFYPKDSTPGCTIEGHDFTRLNPEFTAANTVVYGVSRDSLKSHENFKSKEGFCFELLSDESGKLSEMFGVWKEKKNYGKTYMGIERSTFLIDASGLLRREWRGVKVADHAAEVLGAVKSLT